MKYGRYLILASSLLVLSIIYVFIQVPPAEEVRGQSEFSYEVINTYPHDPEAFTQGLVIDGGILYEGTGLNGKSSIRKVDLETGNVTLIRYLPYSYFGEGITVMDDRVIQITWRSRKGFVYNRDTLEQVDSFSISSEGWGLTHNRSHLIMSDGTSTLFFLNSTTYNVVGNITVSDNGTPVTWINELEYIKGKVYGNIWQTDNIAIIDAVNGNVTGWIDLTGIRSHLDYTTSIDVLNGIAYDEACDRIYVTGKLWPNILEIKLISHIR